ncbi:hypothetical protein [Methylibium sp.]|uniref:hypothetical protein n=1 Tax=Methylibium sp. TaxID=2067992 RepID=UPI003D0E3FA0
MIWMLFLALAALAALYCWWREPRRPRLRLQGPQAAAGDPSAHEPHRTERGRQGYRPLDPTGDSK